MFHIRHPKPVVDSRAVAVLVVQQKITREPVQHVLIAEPQSADGSPVPSGKNYSREILRIA